MFSWEKISKWLWGNKDVALQTASTPGTGALPDTRTEEEKSLDIQFAEIVAAAAPVTWELKPSGTWRKFPAFNQNGCSACVAFTMAKLLGIMRWLQDGIFVTFAPGHIYIRRTNDTEGMNGNDPYAIAAQGVTLDAVYPSQSLSEAQITALKLPPYAAEIAQLFKLDNPKPIILPVGDIDAVASVIQKTGKGVMVWFYFTAAEWGISNGVAGSYNIPQANGYMPFGAPEALRHSVTAVESTLTPDGKKGLIVEDSAWFGGFNRRLITEDFYKARNFYAAYAMNFRQEQVVDLKYHYVFTKPLLFIPWDSTNNQPAMPTVHAAQMEDVKALQYALQTMRGADGRTYFPPNVLPSGYYGALTAQAIYAWQSEHLPKIPRSVIEDIAGERFGTASIAEMNAELV